MNSGPYDKAQLNELLFQAVETEQGGVTICETAIGAARAGKARDQMLRK